MEKYFELLNKIEKEDINITKLYILSCIDISDQKVALEKLDYIYDTWLDMDVDVSIDRLCSIVEENWEEIQNDEFKYNDIINELF